jgi:hypothetical protein
MYLAAFSEEPIDSFVDKCARKEPYKLNGKQTVYNLMWLNRIRLISLLLGQLTNSVHTCMCCRATYENRA